MIELYKEVGRRIQVERKAARITQTELASYAGFARPVSISEIEKGKVRCQLDTLYLIAEALGISIYCLLPACYQE